MIYKIIAHRWYSGNRTVGVVAYDTGVDGYWNAVIGYVPEFPHGLGGLNADIDLQKIAEHGCKLEWNVAREMFPHLDITKHKYYPRKEE